MTRDVLLNRLVTLSTLVATTLLVGGASGKTLRVGSGQAYAKPCAAFAAAATGDVVEIDASGNGTYDGDVCAIATSGLTIRGVGGRAHVDAAGQNAQGKGIWVVQGDDVTIENVELSGAAVPDLNGAGIRAEGTNLTIRGSYFHDDENGILGGAGELLIETSEFAKNGNCINPAGCAHNMYVSGNVTKFTLRYSYSHDVTDGHLVKSRAHENYILYNRLTGEGGTDSYELSLPNAGDTYVVGNLIEQGATTGNSVMLDYGSEGATNPGSALYVVNNTFVNDRAAGGTFVSVAGSVTTPAVVKNNVFVGTGTPVSQANAVLAKNFSGDPLLVNRAAFDYHLRAGSPCIDAGEALGTAASGFSLVPDAQYVHPAAFEGRASVGAIDIGAYELGGGGGVTGAGGSNAGGAGGSAGSAAGSGGAAASGGSGASGGGASSGGVSSGTGGANGSGAAAPLGDASTSVAGGDASMVPSAPSGARDAGGCGCRAGVGQPRGVAGLLATLALVACGRRQRRPRAARPRSAR